MLVHKYMDWNGSAAMPEVNLRIPLHTEVSVALLKGLMSSIFFLKKFFICYTKSVNNPNDNNALTEK